MIAEIYNLLRTLRDDFGSTEAGYLDAAISSRAPASTALSSSVWTGTKAGYLDAAISSIGSAPPISSGLIRPTTNAQLETIGASSGLDTVLNVSASETVLNQWETLVEVASGAGVIEFLALWQTANASNLNTEARLSIDGNVVWNSASNAWQGTGDANKGFCLVGSTNAIVDVLSFGAVPFKSSFKLEFRPTESGGGTVTLDAAHSYFRTG